MDKICLFAIDAKAESLIDAKAESLYSRICDGFPQRHATRQGRTGAGRGR